MENQTPAIEENWNEAVIIEAALLDPAAFAPLYDHYAPRVLQYLLTRSDSQDDALDLTQIVFLRAIEALPSLHRRYTGLFAAWLFRIAHNAATDARRRQRQTIPWDHVPETLLLFPGLGPEPATAKRETLNVLRMVVSELSQERQELIALRFAAKLSFAEIASIMGKKDATVRKQLLRTVQTLQEWFDDYGL